MVRAVDRAHPAQTHQSFESVLVEQSPAYQMIWIVQ